MISVKYVSRSLLSGDLGALHTLQGTCVSNNAERGITGALYYDAGIFFQILEGPAETVEPLVETIAADPRHANMQVLETRGIQQRLFGGWHMKFVSGLIAQRFATAYTLADFTEADIAFLEARAYDLLSA